MSESARSKLDGVLLTLVKNQDIPNEEPLIIAESDDSQSTCSAEYEVTPSKRRKHRRTHEEMMEALTNTSDSRFVMKLFERSVDLAVFPANSPLYPICRAWIRDDPYHVRPSPSSSAFSEEEESDFIHQLPAPIKHEGNEKCFPLPISEDAPPLDINSEVSDPPEQLLLNHMQRWKAIRQSWQLASLRREKMSKDSLSILKSMYDSQGM